MEKANVCLFSRWQNGACKSA